MTTEPVEVLTVTPDKVAAAPTMAYRPGMTQLRSPLQALKATLSGYEYCIH